MTLGPIRHFILQLKKKNMNENVIYMINVFICTKLEAQQKILAQHFHPTTCYTFHLCRKMLAPLQVVCHRFHCL